MEAAEQIDPADTGQNAVRPVGDWQRAGLRVPIGPSSSFRRRLGSTPIPANLAGAVVVYLYFNYVDPLAANPSPRMLRPLLVFLLVTATLMAATWYVGRKLIGPVAGWRRLLRLG